MVLFDVLAHFKPEFVVDFIVRSGGEAFWVFRIIDVHFATLRVLCSV